MQITCSWLLRLCLLIATMLESAPYYVGGNLYSRNPPMPQEVRFDTSLQLAYTAVCADCWCCHTGKDHVELWQGGIWALAREESRAARDETGGLVTVWNQCSPPSTLPCAGDMACREEHPAALSRR